jgi:SAM-dependent methyltransferase
MAHSHSDAWSAYWAGAASGAAESASFDHPDPAVRAVMEAPWRELARQLAPRARVLDLATGGGIVLKTFARLRSDLKLTGVDLAQGLPRAAGMKLIGGISLDALPFPAASFDAVTSRFGIEYADLERAGAEAGRVMKPGGKLRLLAHHHQSAVVSHNALRLQELRWAWRDSGQLEQARALVRGRRVAPLPTPFSFRRAAEEARLRSPQMPVAWEFLTAIAQTLDMGRGRGEADVLGALATLESRAASEVARLEALMQAACDPSRLAVLTGALGSAGVTVRSITLLKERAEQVLAWQITGSK